MDTPSSRAHWVLIPVFLAISISGCQPDEPAATEEAQTEATLEESRIAWIDAERLANADSEPHNWLAHGRTPKGRPGIGT